MSGLPELVLCIPGPWGDRSELIRGIAANSEGYLCGGQIMMDVQTRFSCEFIFEPADDKLYQAFRHAGWYWRDTPEMQAVAGHRSVVYLAGKGGSEGDALSMVRAGAAMLKAGGLAVKVDSSGIAHSALRWAEFVRDGSVVGAFDALVAVVQGEGQAYTCGMHCFGLADVVVNDIEPEDIAELLRVFCLYQLIEAPTLLDGQTFATKAGGAIYTLRQHPGIEYPLDSLFHNPYGTWQLVQVE